jgi:hypothetical protein
MQIDFFKFNQISRFQSELTCLDPLFFIQWQELLQDLRNYLSSEDIEFSLKALSHYELFREQLDLGLEELCNKQYMCTQHNETHMLLTPLDNTRIFLLPWKVKDSQGEIYYFGEDKIVCPNGKILDMYW